jgi:hypothetical protein
MEMQCEDDAGYKIALNLVTLGTLMGILGLAGIGGVILLFLDQMLTDGVWRNHLLAIF